MSVHDCPCMRVNIPCSNRRYLLLHLVKMRCQDAWIGTADMHATRCDVYARGVLRAHAEQSLQCRFLKVLSPCCA